MTHIARVPTIMTAEEFVTTDQSVFGNDWRYELVDGVIEGHAALTPAHGVICANLDATIEITSIGSSIPLIELYENAVPADDME